MTVLGQWRFFNNQASGTQAAVLFGLKAPTGRTRVYDRQGERFETEFQPGSGSYDPLAGLALSQRFGRWSFDTNVLYVFANKGAQRTNLGDRFQYNAALSYRLFGSGAEEVRGVEAGPSAAYMHAGQDHTPATRHEHRHGDAPDHVHSHELEVPRVPQLAIDAVLELNGEWHETGDRAREGPELGRECCLPLAGHSGFLWQPVWVCVGRGAGGQPHERAAIEAP